LAHKKDDLENYFSTNANQQRDAFAHRIRTGTVFNALMMVLQYALEEVYTSTCAPLSEAAKYQA
jgi:hypothetical protein